MTFLRIVIPIYLFFSARSFRKTGRHPGSSPGQAFSGSYSSADQALLFGGSVGAIMVAASRAVLMMAPRRNGLSIRENACSNTMVSRVLAKHLRGSLIGGFFSNTLRKSITFEFDTKHLRASSHENYDRNLTP
jgi:hypothetical protein